MHAVQGHTLTIPSDTQLPSSSSLIGCVAAGSPDAAAQCSYKIEVKTADVRGAGTDANVSVGG